MRRAHIYGGEYRGWYNLRPDPDGKPVWVHSERTDSLPVTERTMDRWVCDGKGAYDHRDPKREPANAPETVSPYHPVGGYGETLAAEPVVIPSTVAAAPAAAEVDDTPRPLTIAEANFAAEIDTWSRPHRMKVLQAAGIQCGTHQDKRQLGLLLLMLYRRAHPIPKGSHVPQDRPRPDDDGSIADLAQESPCKGLDAPADYRFRLTRPPRNADDIDAMVFHVMC